MLADLKMPTKRWQKALCAVVLGLLFLLGAAPVHADPILTITSVEVQPGASSFFDVFIEIDSGPGIDLGLFAVEVSVDAASGVSFTGIDSGPSPVFDGNVVDESYDFSLTTTAIAIVDTIIPQSVPLISGDVARLFRVYFTLDSSVAIGTVIPISFTVDPELPPLFDGEGAPIDMASENFRNGTITAVPVPPTMMLGLVGGSFLFAARWRRKEGQISA
jgi:hypothetical protein